MSSEIEIAGMKISGVDWDATPEMILGSQRNQKLRKRKNRGREVHLTK
jgi:hypothetical protein